MKDIIIISHEPLTINLKRLFYIDDYIREGFNVEYWDLSVIIYGKLDLEDKLDELYIRKFLSFESWQLELRKINIMSTIFIVEVVNVWKNRIIFKTLSDINAFIVRIDQYGNTALAMSKYDILEKLLNLKNIPKLITNKISSKRYNSYKRKYNIQNYNLYFGSSSLGNIVTNYINHPDYEQYLVKKDGIEVVKPFILFIDNYFPLHPDFEIFYGVKLDGADQYQKSLCLYFDYLESKYGIPIVIAAHPKANYCRETFDGRQIVKYRTVELVIQSSYVIMHASNSISFVLLANKPLLMITTNGYKAVSFLYLRLKQLARLVSCQILNIDEQEYNKVNFNTVDRISRDEYIYTYLTKEDIKGKHNIDIIIDVFKNNN